MSGIIGLDALGILTLPVLTARTLRKRKIYDKRLNPFLMTHEDFLSKYKFSKEYIRKVAELIKEDITKNQRGSGVSPELQVLIAISTWGQNEIQDDSGYMHGISQSTVSNVCKRVALALARRSRDFFKMPRDTAEQEKVMKKFENVCGFKGVIGTIGCTRIKIKKQPDDDDDVNHYHVDSKGYCSLNCQVVCDENLRIRDIVARWRGGTHKARIFAESSIKERLERGEFHGRLLGDSGYPCSRHLFTPILNPECGKEVAYNVAHMKTRNAIERCFRVWKERFRVLSKGFNTSLENTKITIIALAVLHNIALDMQEIIESDTLVVELDVEENNIYIGSPTTAGDASRTLFVDAHF